MEAVRNTDVLLPVLAQAGIAFGLLGLMAKERLAAIKAGQVKTGEPGERPVFTGRAGTVSNAYHNQFEIPVLFYAVVAFALIAGAADWEMTALAWGYVICRLIQAGVHVTSNHVPSRFVAFVLSNAFLIAMWVNLGLYVVLGW